MVKGNESNGRKDPFVVKGNEMKSLKCPTQNGKGKKKRGGGGDFTKKIENISLATWRTDGRGKRGQLSGGLREMGKVTETEPGRGREKLGRRPILQFGGESKGKKTT